MQSSYNFWLVAISFAVAVLASYTALDLTGRIFLLASARLRHTWRLGGATGDPKEFRQHRHVVAHRRNDGLDAGGDFGARRCGVVRRGDPEVGPEEFDQRLQRA